MSEPKGLTESEEAFLEYLATGSIDDSAAFDAFCEDRPHIADDLRKRRETWPDVQKILDFVLGPGSFSHSVSERLGATTASGVGLSTVSAPKAPEEVSDTIEMLAGRSDLRARYRMERELGRGGMGVVYKVWDEDLKRFMAMKVMKRAKEVDVAFPAEHTIDGVTHGWHSREAHRFLNEALVTAQLDHPVIVPVHTVGADLSGRLFFTMKLVKGRTLAEVIDRVHAREDGWTLTRAIGVILRVCEAVAYAHSKGVMHRDIKPANVMVGRFGATYLMDWGLNKALSAPASNLPDAERDDEPLADADEVEVVDAFLSRNDRLKGTVVYMAPEQARRENDRVDERADVYSIGALLYHLLTGSMPYVDPDRETLPSLVLHDVRTRPPTPVRELAEGAPDTLVEICERAMERDPDERFASADELADRLDEYLRDVSEEREEARRQASRARLISGFLQRMLVSEDPAQAQGREVTVREVLDEAAENIESELHEHPADEAALRLTIGNIYRELGLYPQAAEHLRASQDLHREVIGDDHPDTLRCRTDLAFALHLQGRYDEVEPLLRDTLRRQEVACGPLHLDTLQTVSILGQLLRAIDEQEEAEQLHRRALEGRLEQLGEDHASTLASMVSLAQVVMRLGRYEEAMEVQRGALAGLRRTLGNRHPSTLNAMNALASMLEQVNRVDEAQALFERVLRVQIKVLGRDHAKTITTMNNLGWMLKRSGKPEMAEKLLSRALEGQRARMGSDHPATLGMMNNLGLLLGELGREVEAEMLLREALSRAVDCLPPSHRLTARLRTNLGRSLFRQRRLAEAREELEQAFPTLLRLVGAHHPWTAEAAETFIAVLRMLGEPDAAVAVRAQLAKAAVPDAAREQGEPR